METGPSDPQHALEQYRRAVEGYDRHMRFGSRARRRLIDALRLGPGDVVLDVGCGTGLSFPLIEERVGPQGRIVGVELSPEMLAEARRRVAREGWQNVTLVEASAEEAEIPVTPDAVVFFFTHDVMRSERALENVLGRARPGARVGAAGGKWAPRWAVPVNAVVRQQAVQYVTTFEGFDRPWTRLERFVPEIEVKSIFLGGAYLAWGRLVPLAQ